jgi:hypothetical protein
VIFPDEDRLIGIVHAHIDCVKTGSWERLWQVDRLGILRTAFHEGRLFIATRTSVAEREGQEHRYRIEAVDSRTGTMLYSIETGEPADLCCEKGEFITVEYGRFHKECDIVVRSATDGRVRRTIPVSRPEATDGRYTSVTVWKASVVGRKIYLSISDKKRNNRITIWNLDTGDCLLTTDAFGQGVTEIAETGRLLWGRVLEIVSKRNFTVLWDTVTDEPLCRFYYDSPLTLYESGGEMIAYRNGKPVRFDLRAVCQRAV